MTYRRLRQVLVVDDDEDLRFLVRCWLETSDRYQVVGEADSGTAAIEASRQLQPDLAIVDVSLPNGDGEEATRIIGSVSPRTKVLAYSASIDRSFVLGMIGAGADGYLVKSGHFHELLEALDTVVGGDIYLSPSIRNHVFDHVRSSIRGESTRSLHFARDQQIVDVALQPGALKIALQPIVDLQVDRVVGHEALSRFAHVDGPGAVFEAAARIRRSDEVELTAAQAAINAVTRFRDGDPFLSINASPGVVMDEEFHALIATRDPTGIVIELTEQTPVRDYRRLNVALDQMRARGIRLAIDDVGAGFACLTHVHRLLPDIIKIDRYLIDRVYEDAARQSMVKALVNVAAAIGATVIAEGIEQSAELRCVRDLGVQLGQGYLLGAPAVGPPVDTPHGTSKTLDTH